MKNVTLAILAIFTLFFTTLTKAQVGIGNTSPMSMLDIQASDPSNPASNDGILIPRVSKFPETDPGHDQNGMLVYLTAPVGTFNTGFHYWHAPENRWISVGAEEWKDGFSSTGEPLIYASQAKLSGTDVIITDSGKVGIGTDTPVERFEFKGPGDNDFQITSANTNPPNIILFNTGGTLDAPAAFTNANQEIGSIIVKTHDGTGIKETGGFRFYIDGLATPGSAPSKFVLNTTPAGSTSQLTRVVVKNDGKMGIGTQEPTEILDVAGNIRVRNLGSGALYSDSHGNISNAPMGPITVAAGLVEGNGNALKIYGATVSRINKGNYQVTFSSPRSSNNYIINLASADCNDAGDCDYDDPGITYLNRQTTGFRVNIGDSDNGGTAKEDIDLEFTFSVIDF
ncbi:hypothetical protein [Cochleicola gelatinilyticus]|uniref:Uncharacterized protein n=1 Tax=Cochleicola gelatinilyticus TaxID=1763537 RepID=A0A167HJZ3_9FLAO|nr:hypothetical protein [Cochleicola gelatinilyticus]OAB78694.1 hypothetical protein ULVI_08920 [Cochleicola gelatinilyticus]